MSSGWTRLLHLTQRLFGDEVAVRVIAPLLADWNHDRHQAGPFRRLLLACQWSLALASTLARLCWRHTSPGWQAVRAMGLFSAAGTVLLMTPFVRHFPARPSDAMRLVSYLTPQAVALAVPFALLPVAMVLGAAATDERITRMRRQLAALTAAVMLMTATSLAWFVPEANQAFRESARAPVRASARPLPRGVRELDVVDLWQARGVGSTAARQELRSRLSLGILWPLALACLGWRLGRRRVGMSRGALGAAWAGAALLVAAVDPLRAAGRDVPVTLMPCLWLLCATLIRHQRSRGTDTPFLRRS